MADGTHNDGGLVFGSQIVTIPKVGGHAFIAKNIKLSRPVTVIESKDELGQPKKEVMVPQAITGSMTLTIIDEDTKAPAMGARFDLVPHGGDPEDDAIAMKVAESDEGWDQNGEGSFEVNFRKFLNPT